MLFSVDVSTPPVQLEVVTRDRSYRPRGDNPPALAEFTVCGRQYSTNHLNAVCKVTGIQGMRVMLKAGSTLLLCVGPLPQDALPSGKGHNGITGKGVFQVFMKCASFCRSARTKNDSGLRPDVGGAYRSPQRHTVQFPKAVG